jgi:hypothetical protein
MRKQMKKWQILLVIGLLSVSLGNVLNHFGMIGDAVTGFFIGSGLGLEILALFNAKKNKRCNLQFK